MVFLDVRSDRYFCLSGELEKSFFDYLENHGHPNADVSALVERNILRPTSTPMRTATSPIIDGLEDSALEKSTSCNSKVRATEFLEVLAIVCSTRVQLRLRKLSEVLNALIAHRERGVQLHRPDSSPTRRLLEAASVFRRSRLLVPIETCCLLDSLALAKFLSRRGLRSDLVFGVTTDPFSAHCWLQAGTLVLNDTVGNAKSYTPIRVV